MLKKYCMFAVKKLEVIRENGRVLFFKLIKDEVCWFDEFYEEQMKDAKHASDLRTVLTVMDYMAETNAILPKEKFNSIKRGKSVIGYEFKKNELRVYCLKPASNMVVVFGGYKKNQGMDIKRLQKIAEEVKDEIEELIKEKMNVL